MIEKPLAFASLFDWVSPLVKQAEGPVTAEIKVRGLVRDLSEQTFEPGDEPGTRKIVSSLVDQAALGSVSAKAHGTGEIAQVAITGAISGSAKYEEGRVGMLAVRANLRGMAAYHAFETDSIREQKSVVSGSVSVFARAERGGIAQASISCVSAMIGPAG